MINLEKCPFCGGYPVCTAYSNGHEGYRVICDMCLSSGANYSTAKIAAEQWNKRAYDSSALKKEQQTTRMYFKRNYDAIRYLSKEIDGDNPTLDQTLSQAIRILEGNDL